MLVSANGTHYSIAPSYIKALFPQTGHINSITPPYIKVLFPQTGGGAEENRTPDRLNAIEALDKYLEFLEIKALSGSYILSHRQYLGGFVNTVSTITVKSAYSYFSLCKHRKVNTRIRYAGYLKGFLGYMGLDFNIPIHRPKLLPEFVNSKDIAKLRHTLRNHKTHKSSVFRDVVLVDTAIKTGLRRSELANLLVCHLDLNASRLIVVAGKGGKDRVIPICASLRQDLEKLTCDKGPNESVFGLKYRSLGMKIREWSEKAGVPIHTHSFRHYFATTLVEKGANIRVVQELLGHSSLNTTQVYLSVTANHLEEAIRLLDE